MLIINLLIALQIQVQYLIILKKLDETLGLASAAKTNSTGACQCMVPVDPTFTLVPMSGYTSPYRNDDGSSNSIPLGFNFCFYGTTYT